MATNIVNPPFPQQSGSAPYFGVRAWVNFNGTGTVAINGSGNVSSVTRNNTGDYTVNFAIALPNANYGVSGSANSVSATNSQASVNLYSTNTNGTGVVKTTSSCRVLVANSSTGAPADYGNVSLFFVG
jgi:hypothetical protein